MGSDNHYLPTIDYFDQADVDRPNLHSTESFLNLQECYLLKLFCPDKIPRGSGPSTREKPFGDVAEFTKSDARRYFDTIVHVLLKISLAYQSLVELYRGCKATLSNKRNFI